MVDPFERLYPESAAGGYSRVDGTVDFYSRIASLINPDMVVVDFGAGRGLFLDAPASYRRDLQNLQGRVRRLIGVDVDPVVLDHPALDDAVVYQPPARLPLEDASVDLIVSDHVFEHIDRPDIVAPELTRILKPGGWLCARTPNRRGYIALGARLVPNRRHAQVLARAQPHRQERDVFPTVYRLNTRAQVRKHFPEHAFELFSYTVESEPAYFGNSLVAWRAVQGVSRFLPQGLGSKWMFFLRRKPGG